MAKSRSNSRSDELRNGSERAAAGSFRSTVRRSIERNGERPRTGPRFQPSICRHCHQITLHGITAEGLSTHLDPTPLDTHTEARALTAGRTTWHMTANLETCWRTASKITHRPAGNYADYAVFAEHECGNPIPATISSWAWGPHAPTPTSEEPGF